MKLKQASVRFLLLATSVTLLAACGHLWSLGFDKNSIVQPEG
jgi:hypothetical protein